MKALILIQAEEGNTDEIIAVQGDKEYLKEVVIEKFQKEMEATGHLYKAQRDDLISMLDNHDDWNPGRYVLTNVGSHWKEWTLLVLDGKYYDTY